MFIHVFPRGYYWKLSFIKQKATDLLIGPEHRRHTELEFKFPSGLAPRETNMPNTVLGLTVAVKTYKVDSFDYILVIIDK